MTKDIRKIDTLRTWDKNPRGVDKKDFERLKSQLKKYGQYKPLLVNKEGIVLGGNMRLKAMQDMGITEVWVSEVDAQTEQKMVEYALSDNDRIGYYEDQALAELVASVPDIDLSEFKVDLGKPVDLEQLLQQFGPEPVEDEAPGVEDGEAVSKLGEIYQLGRHRVMCGDSTKIEDVEKLMDGKKADMVFTDPPYGVDFQSNMRTKSKKFDVLENDDVILTDWIAPAVTFSTGWVLFCTTWKVLEQWFVVGKQIGELSNMIIWDKGGGGIGDLEHTVSTDYEIILAYNRGNKITGKRIGSVWSIGKDDVNSYAHPTQKPVGLAGLAIRTFSSGDVLDLFLGSGSTLIACEQTNRICYGMELDPHYVDVIRKRYAKFIGKEDEWESVTPSLQNKQ